MSTKDAKSQDKVLTVVLDRDGVLADVLEPQELEVAAAALAVDTLADGLADDDVLQGAAALDDESGVLLAWTCSQYLPSPMS